MQVRTGGSYEVDPNTGEETHTGGTDQPQAVTIAEGEAAEAPTEQEPRPPEADGEPKPSEPRASQGKPRRAPSADQPQE